MSTIDNSTSILLTETDRKRISEFSKTINVLSPQTSLDYALTLQKKVASLPNTILKQLKTDLAPKANENIVELLAELETFTPDVEVLKHPLRNRKTFKQLRLEYDIISDKVSKLLAILQEQELVLLQNASTLNKLHDRVVKSYKSIFMHIEAGRMQLEATKKELESFNLTSNPTYSDLAAKQTFEIAIRSFEERLASLEVTKNILTTVLVQVKAYIATNNVSLRKVKETYHKTIPTWRKKITLALRIGDVVDVIYTTKGGETAIDVEATNKGLCESIIDLKESFVSNQNSSKAALDQVYLLSKEIEKISK